MAGQIEGQLRQIIEERSQATELDRLIQGYRLCARSEGKSPNTITLTTTALSFLKEFLEANDLPTDVTLIGARELRRFILHLQEVKAWTGHPYIRPRDRGLSGHSVNCYLRSIRAFWSWLVSEEVIHSSPWIKVKIPKPPKKVIPAFSEAQIRALLGAIDRSTREGFRDWTVILTLLDTGLRVTELTNLRLEDVDLDEGVLKVCGKGAKERMVPIGARVQRALWRYVNRYRRQPINGLCGNLFLSKSGRPLPKNRIEALLKIYGKKAEVEGVRCSPHSFRHSFAISYLRNGGDVFTLQHLLGHTTLQMTQRYLQSLSDEDAVRDARDSFLKLSILIDQALDLKLS